MGVRENKVEKYLHQQVELLGGTTRKWTSPGRDGVPDRLVFIQRRILMVEVKTVDGKLSKVQEREHERLREHGCLVWVVYGETGVDEFITKLKFSLGMDEDVTFEA